jgi:hypothetical protein
MQMTIGKIKLDGLATTAMEPVVTNVETVGLWADN